MIDCIGRRIFIVKTISYDDILRKEELQCKSFTARLAAHDVRKICLSQGVA